MSYTDNKRSADSRKVLGDFAQSLVEIFGMPKPPNGSQLSEADYGLRWIKDLCEDLGGFNAETLERARKILRQTTKYKSMPNNAEIIAAAREAWKQLETERPRLKVEHKSREQRTFEARESFAIELMRASPLGRKSCEEGWHGELFRFVRDNGHLPRTQSEIKILIDGDGVKDAAGGANGTAERLEGLISGQIDVGSRDMTYAEKEALRASLIRLGQSMLAKRDAIARAVVDGEVFTWGR